jgi:multiple antibiotic resistance protein
LTKGFDSAIKRRITAKVTITAFMIVLVLAFAGKLIFVQMFGLTLPASRITGGIVIFIVGLELLRGHATKTAAPAAEGKLNSDWRSHRWPRRFSPARAVRQAHAPAPTRAG